MKLGQSVQSPSISRRQTDHWDARDGTDYRSRDGRHCRQPLRSIVDRSERLENEQEALAGDIEHIFAEPQSANFDVAPTRHIARGIRAARFLKPERCFPGPAELFAFLARVGCRQMDAATLEWRQVDLPKRQVTFLLTKTSAPRVVQIMPRTAAWMARFERGKPDKEGRHLVFRDANGGPIADPAQCGKRAMKRAGV